MKTKKTIRKMTPLARKLGHLSRDLNGLRRRLDTLTNEAQSIEMCWKAEVARADENLRLLRVGLDNHSLDDETAERDCTIEGMGCEHIPGNDECNGCGNYQAIKQGTLLEPDVDANDARDEDHEKATEKRLKSAFWRQQNG